MGRPNPQGFVSQTVECSYVWIKRHDHLLMVSHCHFRAWVGENVTCFALEIYTVGQGNWALALACFIFTACSGIHRVSDSQRSSWTWWNTANVWVTNSHNSMYICIGTSAPLLCFPHGRLNAGVSTWPVYLSILYTWLKGYLARD